jgi:hypothetical protein
LLLFTIAEFFNKVFGLLLISILARSLSVEYFAEFSLILVIFGYFLEIAFFSYQNKNLLEYGKDRENYLVSSSFSVRQRVMLITSLSSFIIFNIGCYAFFHVNAVPLSFVLLLPLFTVDFALYANKKSSYIIMSRFFSQLIFLCFLLASVSQNLLTESSVMYYYALNSLLLTLFVFVFASKFRYINIFSYLSNIFKVAVDNVILLKEFLAQVPIFTSKIIVLLIVTIEASLLLVLGGEVNNDIVISHRITLIVLPFIIFYLSSNAEKVSENDMCVKIIITSILSCVAVLFSPLIVRVMFGEQYLENAQNYALFFFIIPFQSFLNYLLFWCMKNNFEKSLVQKMYICIAVYTGVFCITFQLMPIDIYVLVLLIFFKSALFIWVVSFLSIKTKITATLSVLTPILISIAVYRDELVGKLNFFFIELITQYGIF